MYNVIRVPMTEDVYDELEDAFIGNDNQTEHDFIWGLIRSLCKDAKTGKLYKLCTVNLIKDGAPIQEQLKLKDVTLSELPSNPDWIPDTYDKEDVKYFEHQATTKIWEYLKLHCSFALLRHTKYVDSMQQDNIARLEKMKKDPNTKPEVILEAEKIFQENLDKFVKGTPKCMEEVIFNALSKDISKKVTENIEFSLDKENEELYPKIAKSSK